MSKHNRERRRIRQKQRNREQLTSIEVVRIHKHGKRKLVRV